MLFSLASGLNVIALLAVLAVLACAACASAPGGGFVVVTSPGYFLVLREVPPRPAFVVLPFNTREKEIIYADRVEQALLASRVSVLVRPGLKEIGTERETQTAIGAGQSPPSSPLVETAGKRESYVEWGATDADYIVRTHAEVLRIKAERGLRWRPRYRARESVRTKPMRSALW